MVIGTKKSSGIESWSIRRTTSLGPPTTAAGLTVTPESQAVVLRSPFAQFVWNRPTAVLVEQAETVRRMPIVDGTRIMQVVLLALTAIVVLWSLRR